MPIFTCRLLLLVHNEAMGTYRADYLSDSGRLFRVTSLQLARVSEVDGRQTTDRTADRRFIVPRLAIALSTDKAVCSLPLTPRRAIAYTSTQEYWEIPIPWPGDTPEFLETFQQLNALPGIALLRLEGERINAGYTGLLY